MALTSSETVGEEALLDAATVVEYLRHRGVVRRGEQLEARALGGGVSNVVLAVTGPARQLVVKQSLPRLRVADEWLAPRQRVLSEAAALEVAGRLAPGSAPRVLERDTARQVIVLEHAPSGWVDWKAKLLAGMTATEPARHLGEVTGRWHRATAGGQHLPDLLTGDQALEVFDSLRLEPYYRTTARRAPEVAEQVLGFADALTEHRHCLVHGDLSPKNVLVGSEPASLWLIDFEVAHYGDPAFDLAFLLNHLLLKSLHRPGDRAGYDACAQAFVSAYTGQLDGAWPCDWTYVFGHVGCLLLARVRGKSPVEYLDDRQRAQAWRLGRSLLDDPPAELGGVTCRRDEVLG